MRTIDQTTPHDEWIDLRLFWHQFDPIDWTFCRFSDGNYSKFFYISYFKGPYNIEKSICYSVEAIKLAQTAFFTAVVQMQYANIMICKTRSLSLGMQGILNNKWILFGMFTEGLLAVIVTYVPYINIAILTRMIPPQHFMVPAMPFAILHYTYDECRKLYVRRGLSKQTGKFTGWVAQNN